jgi:hypothetical protein
MTRTQSGSRARSPTIRQSRIRRTPLILPIRRTRLDHRIRPNRPKNGRSGRGL